MERTVRNAKNNSTLLIGHHPPLSCGESGSVTVQTSGSTILRVYDSIDRINRQGLERPCTRQRDIKRAGPVVADPNLFAYMQF